MNLDHLINDLQNYIDRNQLVKAQVAKKIGVSPSGLSHLVSRKVNPTAEQALAILNLTKGNKFMNTTHESEEQLRSEELDRKLSKITCRFENIQSAEFSQGGWQPREGANNDPVDAGSIANVLATIFVGDDSDVAAQLRALVKALKRETSAVVKKAAVNREGITREPVVIKSSHGGARAVVVGTQAFSSDQNTIKVSKGLLDACKADVKYAQKKKIELSHKSPLAELILNNGDTLNCSRANMEMVEDFHNESIAADPETLLANLAMIKEREARFERLKAGKGNLVDLHAKMNAVNS